MYLIGATAISQLLKDNHTIQKLSMDDNNIGDDGITAIATALTNSTIRELWVEKCGITLTGAGSLANLLSVNHTIKTLWLENNSITTEGSQLILQSALNNTACQVDIQVDSEYYQNSEVQTLMDNLNDRMKMRTNEVIHTI